MAKQIAPEIDSSVKPHKPKYDGRHVFLPLCGQLLHGDILLTRNREAADVSARLQSDVIAKVTGGDFSHALICSVPPTFVEALGNGVGNFSIQNGFAHAMRNVRVLRYPDAEIAKMAGNEAARVLGKGYSVADAIASIRPKKMSTPPSDETTFCSALVAAAFANAGAPEFMALDTWKTTPAIIQKLACLHDVTDTVFREALAPQNIEYMSALDGDRSETPSSLQTLILSEFFATMKSPMEKIVLYAGERFRPYSFFECLGLISTVMSPNDDKFETLPDEIRRVVVEADRVACALLCNGQMQEVFEQMNRIDEAGMEKMLAESKKASPDLDIVHLRNMMDTTQKQIESRFRYTDTYKNRKQGFCQSLDEWIAVQEASLTILRQRKAVLDDILTRLG